jgi:hypothetical protein
MENLKKRDEIEKIVHQLAIDRYHLSVYGGILSYDVDPPRGIDKHDIFFAALEGLTKHLNELEIALELV